LSGARGKVIGVTLLAAVSLAAVCTFGGLGGSNAKLAPALEEEEATEILTKIFEKVKKMAEKMVGAAENIKQQIQAQGLEMEDSKIMKTYILPHFEQGFKDAQEEVLGEFDVEEYELEDAVNTYTAEGNKTLAEMQERIRLLYKAFGGDMPEAENEAEAGDLDSKELGLETVLTMLQSLGEHLYQQTDEYCKEFINTHGRPTADNMALFQEGLVEISGIAEKDMLKEHKTSPMAFQKAVIKNQQSKEVVQMIMALQQQNAHIVHSHGIKMAME